MVINSVDDFLNSQLSIRELENAEYIRLNPDEEDESYQYMDAPNNADAN